MDGIYGVIYLNPDIYWHVRMPVGPQATCAPPPNNPVPKPVENFMVWSEPDQHLYRLLQGGPKQFMTLVTETAKALKPRDKRQKTAFKHGVMVRLGTLIRRRSLKCFRGHLVCLPNWRPSGQMTARVASLINKFRGSVNQHRKRERKPSRLISTPSTKIAPVALPNKPKALRRPFKPIKPPLSAAEASSAASALAKLPRKKKRWSGWIGSTRSYRWMPIKLPNGELVFAMGALRGRVVWSRVPGELTGGLEEAGVSWGVVPASRVKFVKNFSAACLGSLKAGRKERPSAVKAASARANGCRPPRPGSRPRGRPRKAAGGPLG